MYKTSYVKAVHLNARETVGGISESPCATQAIMALIVVLHH